MHSTMILPILLLFLAGCHSRPNMNGNANEHDISNLNLTVEPFTFTNQNGEPFGLEQLQGKYWLADFIFTHCKTVCPPMTANMAHLQKEFNKEGLDVALVSFSVDPENDTPQALKEYGQRFAADFSSWNFLTGYSMDEIAQFAKTNFKALVEPDPNSDQVIHVTAFYLVDPSGKVIRKYNGVQPDFDLIVQEIKKLAKSSK
jgi:protein SCO1/2